MKKTITSFLTLLAVTLCANAQTVAWTFESLPDGDVTAGATINNLVINSTKLWTVAASDKTFGDDTYSKTLKSVGAGRTLTFPVSGPGSIEVAAVSASAGEARTYTISGQTLSAGDDLTYASCKYTGPATTLTLTSNAGINIYAIKFTPSGEKPVLNNKIWYMSDFSTVIVNQFTNSYLKDGLFVDPGVSPEGLPMNMTWNPNNKSFNIDGVKTKFTVQLKANGDSKINADNGIPTARIMRFKPTTDGTVSVGTITGGANADRNVIISKYNAGTLTVLATKNTNITEGANGFEPQSAAYTYTPGDEIWIYADNNIQYWFVRFTGSADPNFDGVLSGISTSETDSANEIIYNNGELRTTEPSNIEIYAISGTKIAAQNNASTLSTRDLANGVYIAKCISPKGKISVKKFIK